MQARSKEIGTYCKCLRSKRSKTYRTSSSYTFITLTTGKGTIYDMILKCGIVQYSTYLWNKVLVLASNLHGLRLAPTCPSTVHRTKYSTACPVTATGPTVKAREVSTGAAWTTDGERD